MKVLILGASGATGRLAVSQLVERNVSVKVVVREQSTVLNPYADHELVETVRGNIDEYDVTRMTELVSDCSAVISCLGHNLNVRGMFGAPHTLVYNFVRKICTVAESASNPKRLILMSTTAYINRKLGETLKGKDAFLFGFLKLVLPPHKDNMLAGDYLVNELGSDTALEWIAVRPDSLIDRPVLEDYEIVETLQRNPLSDPGKTSRLQVAHVMADLLLKDDLWQEWKYRTPVIYSKE